MTTGTASTSTPLIGNTTASTITITDLPTTTGEFTTLGMTILLCICVYIKNS